jgi:hypothetical protein
MVSKPQASPSAKGPGKLAAKARTIRKPPKKGIPLSNNIPNRETIKAMRELEQGRTERFTGPTEELFALLLGNKRRGSRRSARGKTK